MIIAAFRNGALSLLAFLLLTGGMAFGQAAVQKNYDKGVEQLVNSENAAAATSFQAALDSKPAAKSKLSSKVRYGLAFALVTDGQVLKALPVLDELVASSPDNLKARYLLGVALIRSAVAANEARGVEVLAQMAREAEGEAAKIAAQGGATLGYNFSTAEYASGNGAGAVEIIDNVQSIGDAPGESPELNNGISFAAGTYKTLTGDSAGAQAALGALLAADSSYALKNGVTAKQALSGFYYKAAADSLMTKDAPGADKALELLAELDSAGAGDFADIHHAKALAYNIKGDAAKVASELDIIKRLDATYYGNITK